MKIQITQSELLSVLSSRFGVAISEFTVIESVAQTLKNFIALHPLYNGEGKIVAIKALRQLSIDKEWYGGNIMGLGDAKWSIEYFDSLISFVEKNNRLPEPGFAYKEMK